MFTVGASGEAGVKRSPIIHLWKGRTYEVKSCLVFWNLASLLSFILFSLSYFLFSFSYQVGFLKKSHQLQYPMSNDEI